MTTIWNDLAVRKCLDMWLAEINLKKDNAESILVVYLVASIIGISIFKITAFNEERVKSKTAFAEITS